MQNPKLLRFGNHRINLRADPCIELDLAFICAKRFNIAVNFDLALVDVDVIDLLDLLRDLLRRDGPKQAAASKVRTPVLSTKLFVSSIIPAKSASASCWVSVLSPMYCTSSATISEAELA